MGAGIKLIEVYEAVKDSGYEVLGAIVRQLELVVLHSVVALTGQHHHFTGVVRKMSYKWELYCQVDI